MINSVMVLVLVSLLVFEVAAIATTITAVVTIRVVANFVTSQTTIELLWLVSTHLGLE